MKTNNKDLKVVQKCEDCKKEFSFLDGCFFNLNAMFLGKEYKVKIFICKNCYPNKSRLEEIVAHKIIKEQYTA